MKAGRGGFDVNRFYTWYRSDVLMAEALAARSHEVLHAEAIAGTKLHLNILNINLSKACGDIPSALTSRQIEDFVYIQEAYPIAYQSIFEFGNPHFKLSNYVNKEIVYISECAKKIVENVYVAFKSDFDRSIEIDALFEHKSSKGKYLILKAFFRVVGNLFVENNFIDGKKFIESIKQIDFSSSRSKLIFSSNYNTSFPLETLETFFSEIAKAECEIIVINRFPEFDFLYLYFNLAIAYSNSKYNKEIVDSLYFSLIQFFFPRLSNFVLAYNKEKSFITLGVNQYFTKRFLHKFSKVLGENVIDKSNDQEKIRPYFNEFDFVYNDFAERFCLGFNHLDKSLHGFHFKNLINAFPSYLISVLDLLVCPVRSIVDKKLFSQFIDHFSQDESEMRVRKLVEEYPIYRKIIWSNLNRAVVDAPRQLAINFIKKNAMDIKYSKDSEVRSKEHMIFSICDNFEYLLPIE